jgi:hypothetical protein
MSTLPELGGLGNMADDLGSLAQAARTKQLKTARNILYIIGILAFVANGGAFFFADTVAGWRIDSELEAIHARHQVADPAAVKEARAQLVGQLQLAAGIGAIIGLVFVGCAVAVFTYPIAATVTSLIVYLGRLAAEGVMAPETIAQGWWLKILIVVGLFKAVQAALAYESERKAVAQANAFGSSLPPDPQAVPDHSPLKL